MKTEHRLEVLFPDYYFHITIKFFTFVMLRTQKTYYMYCCMTRLVRGFVGPILAQRLFFQSQRVQVTSASSKCRFH
jgi:hypothetical protein